MTSGKEKTPEVVERELLADARNENAWEEPVRVPAASSPRPSWYRKRELARAETQTKLSKDRSIEFHIIGEMAVWFANLELYLELSIWQLVASGEEDQRRLMEAVTAEMSFDRKVHAFSSLFKMKFPDEAEDPELLALIKELFIAQDERNAILHSGWSYSPDAGYLTRMKASAKAKRGLTRHIYVMSPDRLAAIRDHIGEVGQRFARFSMERIQERIAR